MQILSKMIEYIEVKENHLVTEIVNAFDEDIDPNSSFETYFEVFSPSKSFDTPGLSLAEKKILQAHLKCH